MASLLLIDEPPLHILPALVREFGLNEALVLQQIHYWLKLPCSRHLIGNHYWVRYSPEQWGSQFVFWDQKTLCRAIRSLERQGVLSSHQTKDFSKEYYYTIDYWVLNKMTSFSKPKLKKVNLRPTYDHANFDPINFDNEEENDL